RMTSAGSIKPNLSPIFCILARITHFTKHQGKDKPPVRSGAIFSVGHPKSDSSVRSGMFIARRPTRSAKLRRSGMWLRKDFDQHIMPLLRSLAERVGRLAINMPLLTELSLFG